MGVTLEMRRSAIGTFLFAKGKSIIKKYYLPKHMFYGFDNGQLFYGKREWARVLHKLWSKIGLRLSCMNFVALAVVIQMLLICGGIHTNPGPTHNNDCYSTIDYMYAFFSCLKQTVSHGSLRNVSSFKFELGVLLTLCDPWLPVSATMSDFYIQNYQALFTNHELALVDHGILHSIEICDIGVDFIAMALVIEMLLICGGIHPNPGPKQDTQYCDISICHANIRSLKQKDSHGSLSTLSHIKCQLGGKFSIITLSETWLSCSDSSNRFRIQGYQQPFRRDREAVNGPTGYGGVLAWVSDQLACKRRSDLEIPNIEAMWLEIRSSNNKFFLCVAYRKPTKHDFWDILQASIDNIKEITGAKILLTGDFNADPQTPEGIKLQQFVHVNGLTIHITEPTRITQHSQTILDQFISNMPQMIKSVHISPPVSKNDHCTIEASLLFRRKKARPYVRTMWDFANADFDLYRNALSQCKWDDCFVGNDIDRATEMWTNMVLNTAKDTIPNKQVTVRPGDKPWYNNHLRRLCRRKDRLHKAAKLTNSPESWYNFRVARTQYTDAITEAKENHEKGKYNCLIREDNSTKKWWSIVKQIQSSNDISDSIPPIEVNGRIITDDKDKASAFNEFFLEASSLDDAGKETPYEEALFDAGYDSLDIRYQDVVDQIACLDKSKSYGPDNISPVFLKEGGEILARTLHRLFTMSLQLSVVPVLWKQANVVPIHKKNAQNFRTNYRPVSLLSVVGKLLERIVFKYVFNYFKEHFILSTFQSGFMPGMSTVTQLIEVYHCFCKAVDEGKEIRVIFLDISKAFDRVWHRGLLYKLRRCGIRGSLLQWFENYLKERIQRVVINGQCSEWGRVGAGVPQGSVLGPLLFLLFIDDIVHVVRHCNIRLFADDTCLFIEVEDRTDTAAMVDEDLAAIAAWSERWLVTFSPSKTKSLTISNKKDANLNPQVFLMGKAIDEVDSHTYLGLKFSSNLRWKQHIDDIATKARKKLNIMQSLKMKVDRKSLEIMYRSFVQPSMEYAMSVWGGSFDSDIDKLEAIHIDGMRLITGATSRSIIANVKDECVGVTLKERIAQADLTMLFKIIRGFAPQYLGNILSDLVGQRHYFLRNHNFRVPLCRLETFKRSFFPRVISLWNELPQLPKEADSVETFKHFFKKEPDEHQVLYYYGDRWPSVHHARMRMGCSKLNSDLFNNLHVLDSPWCHCRASSETTEHYLLSCHLWTNQRDIMIDSIQGLMPVTTDNLLFGNREVSLEVNKQVFMAVHKFIIDTKRFD